MRRNAYLRPRLSAQLTTQLAAMEPSVWGYPCAATLRTGETIDRVYIIEQSRYIAGWGVYPDSDPGKRSIRIEDVNVVSESPSRFPARFAKKIYDSGESGMGYHVFTVLFLDGSRQAYLSGDAVDFIDYPAGKSAREVVDVLPHAGRDLNPRQGPAYYWCLYSDDETDRRNAMGILSPIPVKRLPFFYRLRRSVRRLFR
jgi:hypothetical protein